MKIIIARILSSMIKCKVIFRHSIHLMNSKQNHLFIILGLGSIGKKHARVINQLKGKLICVDPSSDARKWVKDELAENPLTFSSMDEAKSHIQQSKDNKIGVISNWGPAHYSSAQDLVALGVKKLYIEKPLANSLKGIDGLKAIASNVQILGGFQNRYKNIIKSIEEISNQELGGPPVMISSNGGAAGVVTNGIHLIDLAVSIFQSFPISVTSNLSSSNINPRSKDLDFWEGSSTWNFTNNRRFSINFTNQSSVKQRTEIYCLNGKIVINEDMSLDIYRRDLDEILFDNRVIRLGVASMEPQDHVKSEDKDLFKKIFSNLINSEFTDIDRELIATKAIIYSLISNKLEKKMFIGKSVDKNLYEYEWSIS